MKIPEINLTEKNRKINLPKEIFESYEKIRNFKSSLGSRGIYEQAKMNERFFIGDQWNGVNTGKDRPLVRNNVIKRIGDLKLSAINNPVSVNFSADGIPDTIELKNKVLSIKKELPRNPELLNFYENNGSFFKDYYADNSLLNNKSSSLNKIPFNNSSYDNSCNNSSDNSRYNSCFNNSPPNNFTFNNSNALTNSFNNSFKKMDYTEEVNLIMSAMSDYYNSTTERLNYDKIREQAIINAYISGTGIIYTYWDNNIDTGLYLNKERTKSIKGDIAIESLDIENVYFGDSTLDDVQSQPFIIIAQKLPIEKISAVARENGIIFTPAADDSEEEKATVLTKLYKEKTENGITVMGVKCTKDGIIKPTWDLGISLYPLAKFTFLRRKNCPYGESEITYLIPNQIAINRMLTASCWSTMISGMPIMLVNNDIVRQNISNDPGQIIRISGDSQDMASAIKYVSPPSFSSNFDNSVLSLSSATLNMAGANDAALGNIVPDNASAIIAVREAAMLPIQSHQNAYYRFSEEIARIWAEFWVQKYGNRSLKITDENGTWYMPFNAEKYKNLLINARVDVGASTVIGEAQSLQTLDNLFDRGILNTKQYLKRLPAGTVPDVTSLLRELDKTETSEVNNTETDNFNPEIFENSFKNSENEDLNLNPKELQKTEEETDINNGILNTDILNKDNLSNESLLEELLNHIYSKKNSLNAKSTDEKAIEEIFKKFKDKPKGENKGNSKPKSHLKSKEEIDR